MKETKVSFVGGSRIGWVNATWPFARLRCSSARLQLSSFGRHEFTPQQVVSFGAYGSIPLLANGLRIHHNRLDCPEKVVFWCMGSRKKVLAAIARTGFEPRGAAVERPKGFALRWVSILAFVLIWNLLFLIDGDLLTGSHDAHDPGWGAVLALVFAFAVSSAAKMSTGLQALILNRGHVIGEVRGALTLIQLVTGAMAVGFAVSLFFAKS